MKTNAPSPNIHMAPVTIPYVWALPESTKTFVHLLCFSASFNTHAFRWSDSVIIRNAMIPMLGKAKAVKSASALSKDLVPPSTNTGTSNAPNKKACKFQIHSDRDLVNLPKQLCPYALVKYRLIIVRPFFHHLFHHITTTVAYALIFIKGVSILF